MYHLAPWSGRDFGSEAMHVVDKAFVHNLLKFYMHISWTERFWFSKEEKSPMGVLMPHPGIYHQPITSTGRWKISQSCPQIVQTPQHWCNTAATLGTPNCSDAATPSTSISLGWKSHNCATNIHHKLPHLTFSKSTKLWFSKIQTSKPPHTTIPKISY